MSNISDFIPGAPGSHEVTVHTGNGYGSTNTLIRRFTTILTNLGTDITYADSATLGATFTINKPGQYEIYYADTATAAGGGAQFGVSVNSAALTTAVNSIAIATRAAVTANAFNGIPGVVTRTVRLAAGDVVRAHTGSINVNNNTDLTVFSIRKVGQ